MFSSCAPRQIQFERRPDELGNGTRSHAINPSQGNFMRSPWGLSLEGPLHHKFYALNTSGNNCPEVQIKNKFSSGPRGNPHVGSIPGGAEMPTCR